MVTRTILSLPVLFLLAGGVSADDDDSQSAAEVAAYRAEIVASLRERLAALGFARKTRLVASPGGDDRVVIGADKVRVITATLDSDGITTACHEGVEKAAESLAATRGDRQ